jgi:hypothetical protein
MIGTEMALDFLSSRHALPLFTVCAAGWFDEMAIFSPLVVSPEVE